MPTVRIKQVVKLMPKHGRRREVRVKREQCTRCVAGKPGERSEEWPAARFPAHVRD